MRCGNVRTIRFISLNKARACFHCSKTPRPLVEVQSRMREVGFEIVDERAYVNLQAAIPCRCLRCLRVTDRSPTGIIQGGGCAWCAGVSPEEAVRRARAAGAEPLEPYPGKVTSPWLMRLPCGHGAHKKLVSLPLRADKCGVCTPRGQSPTAPAHLYVISHDKFGAVKFGIRWRGERIRSHTRWGWEVYDELSFATGREARTVETTALRYVRKTLRLPPFLSREDMPQDGWTETVNRARFSEVQAFLLARAVARSRRAA